MANMRLKKYKRLPGDTDTTEAIHIRTQRVIAQLREAKKKRTIVSGEADSGIQAMPLVPKDKRSPGTGKYWARPVQEKDMSAFDPSVFKNLPDMIRFKSVQDMVKTATSPEVFDRITDRVLSQGIFAESYKRTGFKPPQYAQLDTLQMQQNVKPGAKTGNAAQDQMLRDIEGMAAPSIATPSGPVPMPKKAVEGPQGQVQTLEQLRLRNLEMDRIAEKHFGRKPAPKNETDDQRNRRLHPELY